MRETSLKLPNKPGKMSLVWQGCSHVYAAALTCSTASLPASCWGRRRWWSQRDSLWLNKWMIFHTTCVYTCSRINITHTFPFALTVADAFVVCCLFFLLEPCKCIVIYLYRRQQRNTSQNLNLEGQSAQPRCSLCAFSSFIPSSLVPSLGVLASSFGFLFFPHEFKKPHQPKLYVEDTEGVWAFFLFFVVVVWKGTLLFLLKKNYNKRQTCWLICWLTCWLICWLMPTVADWWMMSCHFKIFKAPFRDLHLVS